MNALDVLTNSSVIIFGHDGEMDNEPKLKHPAWAKDGSFLVIRKIKQFVPEFNQYVALSPLHIWRWSDRGNCRFLKSEAPKLHFDEEQLAARLVGRWRSGKLQTITTFLHISKHWEILQEPRFSFIPMRIARSIKRGTTLTIPMTARSTAHLRRTCAKLSLEAALTTLISSTSCAVGLRMDQRSVPTRLRPNKIAASCSRAIKPAFPMASSLLKTVSHVSTEHFTSIYWLTNSQGWINPDTFPPNKVHINGGRNPGQDPIVGQAVKGAIEEDDKVLNFSLVDGKKQNTQISFLPFIQSNGGDYFFSPSLELLRKISQGQVLSWAFSLKSFIVSETLIWRNLLSYCSGPLFSGDLCVLMLKIAYILLENQYTVI